MAHTSPLELLLRPAGDGILTVSTGGGPASALQKKLYGTVDKAGVAASWRASLAQLTESSVVVVGIPSDVGAGVRRGANFGPIGIRLAYLQSYGAFPKGVVDLGDIPCVPQLLHDSMLNDAQITATRAALYGAAEKKLPVSPLSLAEEVFRTIHALHPKARLVVLGGDHSVSWPAMLWAKQAAGDRFGILHFDAHTDLLESRFGVQYCFATWAYHGLKLLPPHRLVQVGIRTSGKTKEYWETHLPVRQFWASEIVPDEARAVRNIVEALAASGAESIYISNDVDGTDASFAPATGTPESNGLRPEFVERLVDAVAARFPILGADVTEVAPPLAGPVDFATEPTCVLAARYLRRQLAALGAS